MDYLGLDPVQAHLVVGGRIQALWAAGFMARCCAEVPLCSLPHEPLQQGSLRRQSGE